MFDFICGSATHHDVHYYVGVYSSIAIGLIAAFIAWIANKISKRALLEQKKQFQKQIKIERQNFYKQFELQKEQWLYKYYIERESKVLIKFRNIVYRVEEAVLWFSDILKPYKVYAKMFPTQDGKQPQKNLSVKFEIYCKYYDQINELNNYYNDNQLILKKHGICDEFIYFTAILSTITWFEDTNDFYYKFVDETDSQVRYKLNVIELIGTLFINSIDFKLVKDIDNIDLSYSEEKLNKYSNEIFSIYLNLKTKLDEITTFFDGGIPENLRGWEKEYFPNSENFIKSLKNKVRSSYDG